MRTKESHAQPTALLQTAQRNEREQVACMPANKLILLKPTVEATVPSQCEHPSTHHLDAREKQTIKRAGTHRFDARAQAGDVEAQQWCDFQTPA
eukprot:1161945-Pelagomonas_calceolata.AAC.8